MLKSLFRELRFLQSLSLVLCDNLGATYLSVNPIRDSRSKHVEIYIHFLQDYVTNEVLDVRFVGTEDQLSDIITKPLSSSRFSMLKIKLLVIPNTLHLRRGVGLNIVPSTSMKSVARPDSVKSASHSAICPDSLTSAPHSAARLDCETKTPSVMKPHQAL